MTSYCSSGIAKPAALSGIQQSSLPGMNNPSPSSLPLATVCSWCLAVGGLVMGRVAYTISQIQLQSLTVTLGVITHPLLAAIPAFLPLSPASVP